MHIMSTNFAKTLVWKHGNDVKLWRHKQCTPKTNNHHMTLNQTPLWKFSAYATASVTHDRSENLHWKNFTYSVWYDKFTIQNSWMVFNVFIEKNLMKFVQKLQILCSTEVLIFTVFHYTFVIQASFTDSLLNSMILLCLVQSQLLV